MITKTEVLNKINTLLSYSIQQSPQYQSQYTSLVAPLISAVNTYFDTVPDGMLKALENYVFQTYCDTFSRSIVYKNPVEGANFPTDYPAGYNDIRLCFYTFGSLMNCTNEQFYGGWVIGTPEGEGDSEVTPTPEPISNSYLDVWTAEVTSAPQDDVERVKAVNTWCENSADSMGLINLLEDQGLILESKGTQEIAKIIYLDRGLLEVIQVKGYPVYVPTYLRE